MKPLFKQYRNLAYAEGLELQMATSEQVKNLSEDEVLLVEHQPVYTFGKSADHNNLLVSKDFLSRIGAEVFQTDRGGDITFHGPGQLVGYPILNLHRLKIGARSYIEALENIIIDVLSEYGITAFQIDGLTGIWTKNHQGRDAKVAAIGVRISKGITSHGFALNVDTDLNYFKHMIPCGITDKEVTSIVQLLNQPISWENVSDAFQRKFTEWYNAIEV